MGRLFCQREVEKFGRKAVHFICLSQTSEGTALRSQFKAELRVAEEIPVRTFSRREILEHLGLEDMADNAELINQIIKHEDIKPGTCILFDEVPMLHELDPPSYDWSKLVNTRDDVTAVVCIQPVRPHGTLKSVKHALTWPENADILTLERQFRSTANINNFNNKLRGGDLLPIECIDVLFDTCKTLAGPEVCVFPVENVQYDHVLKIWLHFKLHQLGCSKDQLKILHTDTAKQFSQNIFSDGKFKTCLSSLTEFQGSEADVVVVCYDKAKGDDYGKLLELTSRGRYQV